MITATRPDLGHVEHVGRTEGLAAAVTALLGPAPDEVCAGRGHVALPAGLAAGVRRWRVDGTAWERVLLTPIEHPLAASAGFDLLSVTPAGAPADAPGVRPPPELAPELAAELVAGLAAARLGVARRLLDLAVEHLTRRHADGEPIIRRQLVQGTVADALAAIDMCRHMARQAAAPAAAPAAALAAGRLHARIGEIGWWIATLFGAAGYLADHPAAELYVSELVADVWVEWCPGEEG
ncbi:acyl-CoA dehydrogenase family protein [Microbispora sp. CA-135349]|uniref:acyl-CoA dehydrogenase family protein n=1 Tax=Microbispora sp. CA-135349 TaxID=3239953 RepID=UPI003D9499D1